MQNDSNTHGNSDRLQDLLIGQYAQAYYLGKQRSVTLTETVTRWREYLPEFMPMPHPSPRNTLWLRRNSWFETDVVPVLRDRVKSLLDGKSDP